MSGLVLLLVCIAPNMPARQSSAQQVCKSSSNKALASQNAADPAQDAADKVGNAVSNAADQSQDAASKGAGGVTGAVSGATGAVKKGAETGYNKSKDAVKSVLGSGHDQIKHRARVRPGALNIKRQTKVRPALPMQIRQRLGTSEAVKI